MKNGKEILITATIALLVVMVVALGFTLRNVTSNSKDELDIKGRISQYKLIREEQELITDILTLRYDAAVIQAKFKPAPPRIVPPVVSPAPQPK